MEDQITRKRKILLVMPIPVVPFIALFFYSLGGGTPASVRTAPSKGINTTIPSAELSTDNPMDKLSIYQRAERDSIKRQEMLKSDGFFAEMPPADGSHADGAVEAPFGDDYGNATTGTMSSQARSRQTEARIEQRMAALQKELASMDTVRQRPPFDNGFPGQLYSGMESSPLDPSAASFSANGSAQVDPEMAQLNDMLDKVMRITNPQLAHEQARKSSAADKSRVFPVSVYGKEDVTDFFEASRPGKRIDTAATDSTRLHGAHPLSVTTRLPTQATSNRFYDLEDSGNKPPATAIAAVIHDTKTVTDNATVKLRLEQPIYVQGRLIPAGTFVFGKCSLSDDRMMIPIEEIQYGKSIYPVALAVYSLDGLEGVHIEGSIPGETTRQSANDALQSLQLAAMDPSITQQVAAAGIETVRSIVRKKAKVVKTTLKAGHPVLLVQRESM